MCAYDVFILLEAVYFILLCHPIHIQLNSACAILVRYVLDFMLITFVVGIQLLVTSYFGEVRKDILSTIESATWSS